jgi:hypothetical protein
LEKRSRLETAFTIWKGKSISFSHVTDVVRSVVRGAIENWLFAAADHSAHIIQRSFRRFLARRCTFRRLRSFCVWQSAVISRLKLDKMPLPQICLHLKKPKLRRISTFVGINLNLNSLEALRRIVSVSESEVAPSATRGGPTTKGEEEEARIEGDFKMEEEEEEEESRPPLPPVVDIPTNVIDAAMQPILDIAWTLPSLFCLPVAPLARFAAVGKEAEVPGDLLAASVDSLGLQQILPIPVDLQVGPLARLPRSPQLGGAEDIGSLCDDAIEPFVQSIAADLFESRIHLLSRQSRGDAPGEVEVSDDVVDGIAASDVPEAICGRLFDISVAYLSEYRAGYRRHDALPEPVLESMCRLVAPESVLPQLFRFPIDSLAELRGRGSSRRLPEDGAPVEVPEDTVTSTGDEVAPEQLPRDQTRRPAEAPRQADATGESRDESEEEEAADLEIPDDLARPVGEAVPLRAVLGDLVRLPVNGLRSFTPGTVSRPIPVKAVDKEPGSGHSDDNPKAPGREDGEDYALEAAWSPPSDDRETSTEDDLPEIPDELTQMPSLAVAPADVLPTCFDLPVKPLLRYELRHRPP